MNVTRLGRFANYLRSILPHPDVTLTEMTAKAIGKGGRGEGREGERIDYGGRSTERDASFFNHY